MKYALFFIRRKRAQLRVERGGAVHLRDACGLVGAALVDADNGHPKGCGESCRLGADPAHPDDERGRLGQMHHNIVTLATRRLPLAAQLLRNVDVQPARESQHKRHNVRRDMVVIDFPEIGDLHGMGNQLRVVVTGGRRSLRRLQPAQVSGARQHLLGDRAKGALGERDRLLGALARLRHDDFELGASLGDSLRPFARLFRLRRQHEERDRHFHPPSLLQACVAPLAMTTTRL
jgi:hypothetical protein